MIQKIKQIRYKINTYKTSKDLLQALPFDFLEKTAFFLILLLAFAPILRLLMSLVFNDVYALRFEVDTLMLGGYWSTYLLQIGYLSFILTIVIFMKKMVGINRNSLNWKRGLKTYLPFLFLMAFFLWIIIATVFSQNIKLSFFGTSYRQEGLIMWGAYFGFVGAASQIKSIKYFKAIVSVFLLGALFLAMFSLLNNETLNHWFTLRQRTSIFHNANHYGYYLTIALMSASAFLLYQKRLNWLSGVVLIGFLLNALTLIINRSLGPYIGVLAGLTILSVFIVLKHRYMIKRLILIVSVFIIASLYQSFETNYLSNEASSVSEDISSIVSGDEDSGGAGSGRWRLWTLGITYGNRNFITGQGPDNLGMLYAQDAINNDRAHNEFIQYYATLGIVGVMVYVGVLITYAWKFVIDKGYHDLMNVLLFSIVVGYNVSALFGNTMYYTAPFYFVILSMATIRTSYQTERVSA